MGYKNLCIECRKVYNMGTDNARIKHADCPNCKNPMILMTHRFRPPKRQDESAWKVVRYLIENGFYYQHIYDEETVSTYVPYPNTMIEAKEFVNKYHSQSTDNKNIDWD